MSALATRSHGAVLVQMRPPWKMMAQLLSGCGLGLLECCCLRVKDLDLDRRQITVRAGIESLAVSSARRERMGMDADSSSSSSSSLVLDLAACVPGPVCRVGTGRRRRQAITHRLVGPEFEDEGRGTRTIAAPPR